MNQDTIFEAAFNASKAAAFDHIASELASANVKIAELKIDNTLLRNIIDIHLEKCEECGGSGELKDHSVYVNGEFYGDCPTVCQCCKGTGYEIKIPKHLKLVNK
jgi:excinuclease UvrABC ATPase subunit